MSNTIHALNASARKNSFHSVKAAPVLASTALRSFTPRTSTVRNPTMLSHSTSARGRATRQTSPTTRGTQRMEVSNIGSPLQFVELADVHRGEGFADAEHEDAQHHHRDDHVKEDPDLDHQRHAIGGQDNGREH